MKNNFFIAGLFLVSSVASADWSEQLRNPGNVVYVDTSTVRVQGNLRQVWKLRDLQERSCIAGTCYQSMKFLQEFDCSSEETRTKFVVFYSDKMGNGQPVQTLKNAQLGDSGEFSPTVPGTAGHYELQGICKLKP